MSKIWIVSDLHLGHAKLVEEGCREKGYEREVLDMWGHSVTDKDTVYLLGDIAFSSQAYWFRRISRLPGKKILLLGNHDRNKLNWYKKWGFVEVVPFNEYVLLRGEYGNMMLTHIPAFVSVLTDERFTGLSYKFQRIFDRSSCVLNIHGHTHGKATEKHNTVDVTLEATNNRLVTLDQIMEMKFKGQL